MNLIQTTAATVQGRCRRNLVYTSSFQFQTHRQWQLEKLVGLNKHIHRWIQLTTISIITHTHTHTHRDRVRSVNHVINGARRSIGWIHLQRRTKMLENCDASTSKFRVRLRRRQTPYYDITRARIVQKKHLKTITNINTGFATHSICSVYITKNILHRLTPVAGELFPFVTFKSARVRPN